MVTSARTPARRGRRLATALVVSALLHVFLSSTTMTGSLRGVFLRSASTSLEPQTLTVRLVLPEATLSSAPPAAHPESRSSGRTVPKRETRTAIAVARPELEDNTSGGPADIADATYYGARQLDVYPTLMSALDLPQPVNTTLTASKGYVLLLVLIDATGAVDDVSIVEAQPGDIFDQNAVTALRSV